MKKALLAVAVLAASATAMANPVGPSNPPANLANSPAASGVVNSQSAAFASSRGVGTAYSSTQSGAFATYGQTGSFVNAPEGAQGGTASVTGFAQTHDYTSSQSLTTGTGRAAASSWNSANAGAQSIEGTALPGYAGAATGIANSYVSGGSSSFSAGDANKGVTQIQGNSAVNTSLYGATDSGILTPGFVSVNGVSVPVNTVQTETSATAQSDSSRLTNTTYSDGSAVKNVGGGSNWVIDGGSAKAAAN